MATGSDRQVWHDDIAAKAGGGGDAAVTGDQRNPQELGHGDVGGVVTAQVVTSLPHAVQGWCTRDRMHNHLAEPADSTLASCR